MIFLKNCKVRQKFSHQSVNQYKNVLNWLEILLFGWFLAPLCDDHECTHMYIAILYLKGVQKQVCEQSL